MTSKILKLGAGTLLIVISGLGAVWAFQINSAKVQALEPLNQSKVAQAQSRNQPQPKKEVTYDYVAQQGNSYTLLARKAVQTYGKKFKVNLSPAKIIYAETNLTQQAGSPFLDINQNVSIAETTVKQWVDRAKALTASQEAAWNYYVSFVNFNTDSVGTAR